MPLSLFVVVCAAMPGYEVPHCDIRAMRVVPAGSAISDDPEACSAAAQAKAEQIKYNALVENPGSTATAVGECYDRDEYAQRVMAANQYMIDHGYTSDFTAY